MIKQNCVVGGSTRLHTFGVGSGASQALIKNCAFAGQGNFCFIYQDDQIEREVIKALSKVHMDYMLVSKLKLLNEDDDVVFDVQEQLPWPIEPGRAFEFSKLFPESVGAASFQCDIYDPN